MTRTRNRQSARKAGTTFETHIATYLNHHIDDHIERRRQTGSKDRGDLTGLRHNGDRIVAELKNYAGQLHPTRWTNEAHTEMGNDDAIAGIVIAKRRGTQDPGSQWVLMTVNDLIGILTGTRPDTDL